MRNVHYERSCEKYIRACTVANCRHQAPRDQLQTHACPEREAKLLFGVGARCDVRDSEGLWDEATIVNIAPLRVRFDHWPIRYEETIEDGLTRFLPYQRLTQFGPRIGRELHVPMNLGTWCRAMVVGRFMFTCTMKLTTGETMDMSWHQKPEIAWHVCGILDESDLTVGMVVHVNGNKRPVEIVHINRTDIELRFINDATDLCSNRVDERIPRTKVLSRIRPFNS